MISYLCFLFTAFIAHPANEFKDIVLIFQNTPINYKYRENSMTLTIGNAEISLMDKKFKTIDFTPKYNDLDTIIIKPNADLTIISHAYHGLESWNYFFRPGDTAVFTYQGLKPFVKILNRGAKKYDTNIDYTLSKELYDESFKLSTIARSPGLLRTKMVDGSKFSFISSSDRMLSYEPVLKSYQREQSFIDSIAGLNQISQDIYERIRSDYEVKKLAWQLRADINFFKKKSIAPVNQLLSDYTDEGIYRDGTFGYLVMAVHEIAKKQPLPNMQGLNFKAIYDTAASIKKLGPNAKNQLLHMIMNNLVDGTSVADIQVYLQKFEKDVTDTAIVNSFKQKYGLNSKISNQLVLKHQTLGKIELDNLLKNNKGKVVYIDFWATWCAPCVASLPASAKLRNDYADKDVEFIYISKEDNYENWKKGIVKHGINNSNSFIVDNLHTSKFMDDLNVNFIPRYLIYDRTGELVHRNAPGPDDPKVRELLNFYLDKK